MPLDPARVEETRSWLVKADEDLRAAKVDLQADPPLVGDALFHCQQAVEKAEKGFLSWHDKPFRKTHNLVELGIQCAEADEAVEPLLRRAAKLSAHATEFRYPGMAAAPVLEEASDALDTATAVVAEIRKRLPADVSP